MISNSTLLMLIRKVQGRLLEREKMIRIRLANLKLLNTWFKEMNKVKKLTHNNSYKTYNK